MLHLSYILLYLIGNGTNPNSAAGAPPSGSSGCVSNEPCSGDTPLTIAQVEALSLQNNQGLGVESSDSKYFPNGNAPADFAGGQSMNTNPTGYYQNTNTFNGTQILTNVVSYLNSTLTSGSASTSSPLSSITGTLTNTSNIPISGVLSGTSSSLSSQQKTSNAIQHTAAAVISSIALTTATAIYIL